MNNIKRVILVAIGIICISSVSHTAFAKDVSGKLGVGFDNTLTASTFGLGQVPSSPNSLNAPSFGLSVKYWINNDWAVNGVLGFIYAEGKATTDNYDDSEGIWAFSLDLKGIYNFAKGDNANLGVYLDFNLRKESATLKRPEGDFHSNLGFAFALGLTPEVFLTENFAIMGEFGIVLRVQQGVAFGFSGDNLLGGFGFHYYF